MVELIFKSYINIITEHTSSAAKAAIFPSTRVTFLISPPHVMYTICLSDSIARGYRRYHFGLYQVSGAWVWLSGSTSSYRDWKNGEPNDSGPCATIQAGSHKWKDVYCGDSNYYLCQTGSMSASLTCFKLLYFTYIKDIYY